MAKSVKGLKWINNGISNKRVSLDQLDAYLKDGWVVGQLPTTLNHVWVHKDGKNTTINKDKLEEYLSNGWSKGKILSSKELDRVKVNKDGKTISISKNDLNDYLSKGWQRGIHQKFRWITNDIQEKWTDIELPEGWYEGRLLDNPNELVYVYNKKEVLQIKKKDLNKYKKLGYKSGKGKLVGLCEGSTKNTIWMNDGTHTICVKKELESDYVSKGYVRGNLNARNRLHVKKDSITKYIKLEDLDKYLSDGFVIGSAFDNHMVDKKWVQKDNHSIAVPIEKYDDYIKNGWKPGRQTKASEGKIWIHKGDELTYIDPSELQSYLDDGWHSGKKSESDFYINNGIEEKLVNWDEYNLNYRFNESWKFGTKDHGCSSTIENEFKKLLDENQIKYEQHFYLYVGNDNRKCYYYDFKVGNILIELNPTATHNVTWNPYNVQINIDYHYLKTKFANDSGYRCINIWDWDSIEILIKLLKKKEVIYARQCVIKEVSINDAKEFLNENHFQGYAKDSIRLGLYYKNDLVSVMTFGKPRYSKKFDYELIRYCSISNITGGVEKLFKYFIDNYNPKSIISYCSLDKFSGNTYNKLGFTYDSYSLGKHWYNFKYKLHFTDNLIRQQGFDRLCGNIFGNFGKGTNNEELLLEHDFVEVYDAGQAKYIWLKDI
jgi:hypothetical protein